MSEIAEVDKDLAAAIKNMREDRVSIKPGYDGVFGMIDLVNVPESGKEGTAHGYGQKTL